MFYDLNLPWRADVTEYQGLQNTIIFLAELGYDVIALNYTLSGKLPTDLSCAIPEELPFKIPANVRILRRCTIVFSDPAQNHRLSSLANNYDILALRPTNEKSFQQACQSLECDIISLDMTNRFDFFFKIKTVAPAIEKGLKFEICYAPGIQTDNATARRNLISNATQLIRATRGGRGLVISSQASSAAGCRSPADVINLAAIWGLGQEKGQEAVSKLARSVVVSAHLKRSSYRGVIDVIYGGEKPPAAAPAEKNVPGQKKRAAESTDRDDAKTKQPILSKREQKRRHKALLEAQANGESSPSISKT